MARPLRIRTADQLYHVTAHGAGSGSIFGSDRDRAVFLATVREAVSSFNWRCHSYCVMDTHYHRLIETPDSNLPEGMRWLNGTYGARFNVAHEQSGHVFDGRYHARVIRSHAHGLEVSRYIPLNPVRAGLCREPAEWKWSSYRGTMGIAEPPDFLCTTTILGWFGAGQDARSEFRAFVLAGVGITDPEVAALTQLLRDGTLDQIRFAHDSFGYSLRAIAEHLGVHRSTLRRRLRPGAPKGV